ncbi:MAG: ferrochelatase [Propionicimonas sp.]|uniref:ferrochelatase n=1 Tax=Propionicimonas sp. TaxID=1955623 RepID=UPI0025DEE5E3|nr:ferrochelatase [Propionicimonas sp.]MCG2806153.1 ferrochelatase [Propionicimonas sp.]
MNQRYDAVVLLGFGGPEGVEEVVPFLEQVTAGRGIPPERLAEVGQHYFAMGGVSPINAQNRALLAALSQRFDAEGVLIETALANRNSPPFVPDVLRDLAARGHRRILGVATAAYSGYSACRQYREDLGSALAATGLELVVRKLPPFFDLDGFTAAITELLLQALPSDLDLAADTTKLVFTTHSIPNSMAASSGSTGDAYVSQHRWVAAQVAAGIAVATGIDKPWELVFQSRSGPPQVPWLEPDVNDALTECSATGSTDVVLVPIGFISDHMEVIWDLDTQASQTAKQLGLRLVRTPTVGTHPRFVASLAERITSALLAGVDQTVPGQNCHGDCCLNPRSQAPTVPGTALSDQESR